MVKIGNMPILWHLMKIFAQQGQSDFIIATGYRGEVINSWINNLEESWQIQTLDTGLSTQTGGRVRRCLNLYPNERMIVTYGDGLGNVNINHLLAFHKQSGSLATVTAVRPPARFGVLESSQGKVIRFGEKNQADSGWINGGFFVLEPEVSKLIYSDDEPFETGAIPRLVRENQLSAFHHYGFWQPMDTLREKHDLERLATQKKIPPWLNFGEQNDN